MVGCVGVIVTVSTGRCLPRTLHGRVSGGGMKFVEFLHFLNYEAQLIAFQRLLIVMNIQVLGLGYVAGGR
jgi:hypothetical protein